MHIILRFIVFIIIFNNFIDLRNGDVSLESHAKAGKYPWDSDNTCGLVNRTQSRIVNGRRAELAEFPWMANMFILFTPNSTHYRPYPLHQCGAVIISDYHLITAKHCLAQLNMGVIRSIYFYVGSRHKYETYPFPPYRMVGYIMHYEFDIAVVRVERRIQRYFYGDKYRINRVCLPVLNIVNHKQEWALLSGSGKIDYNATKTPNELRKFWYIIQPIDVCMKKYNLTDYSICAEIKKHIFCHGDSGSPLVQFDGNKAVVIGIVSRHGPNPDVCGEGFMDFVRVSPFVEWIKAIIASDSGQDWTTTTLKPHTDNELSSPPVEDGGADSSPETSAAICNRLTYKTISLISSMVLIFNIFT